MSISVAIIEDQQQTREMLSALVNGTEGFFCVGSFETAEKAIEHIPALAPDVVLADIHLPEQSGIESVRRLRERCKGTQFIMCTSIEDTETIFEAISAGANGYLTKSTSPAKILEAIRDVHTGGSPMSSQIARKVVAHFQLSQPRGVNTELQKLSVREQQVLDFLSKGFRYKEIAAELSISIETVRRHIHNIYEKLHVSSRTDALNKTIYNH